MYRSIKIKPCKSEGCLLPPKLGYAGYCGWNHLPDELKEKIGSKRKLQIKNQNAVKYASVKLRAAKYKENTELELWFRYHMINSEKKCENCGADLSNYNDKDWKGSQHHIIDKSGINGCPSVSTELLNHGVLGKWCCHSQWHTSYENAQKMPFFKVALERFKLFKGRIIEESKIPKCFYEKG